MDDLLADQHHQPSAACATPDQGLLLIDLDYPQEALPTGLAPTRWHQAVQALATRDLDTAVRLLFQVGSHLDAAHAQLRHARQLTADHTTMARAALDRAIAIFDQAGAGADLAHARQLRTAVPEPPRG